MAKDGSDASTPEKQSVAALSDVELNVNSLEEVDWSLEPKLVRKLDLMIIPLFILIYASNFIDRTSIGNAKIAGLEKDLGLVGFQFNIALTIFYVVYIVFDVPVNLLVKHFGPISLGYITMGFGVVTVGSAFVHNFSQLVLSRVFLGIMESGGLSGMVYVMSRYYRRRELVLRIGMFFPTAAALAGAFGGLLASGLLKINNIGSVLSWRKIFLVEGIITIGIGFISLFLIPADPLKTKFLTEPERRLALARIQADQAIVTNGKQEKTSSRLVLRAINFNTFLCTLGFILINISFQGLSLFMPTVIATLGHYSTVQNQLRTVPPYVVALFSSQIIAYGSMKFKNRSIPCLISACCLVISYSIFVGSHNAHARYAACFFGVMGGTGTGPMFLSWATDNAAPDTVRAVTSALVPGFGMLGAVIAVWTYLPNDAPNYHRGNTLNLVSGCVTCVICITGFFYCRWENAMRESGKRDHRLDGKSEKEIEQLGCRHPAFRYQE